MKNIDKWLIFHSKSNFLLEYKNATQNDIAQELTIEKKFF